MIIIQIHNFAHRILNNGLVESAPVFSNGVVGEWEFRSAESMDLTGGDEEHIRHTLQRLAVMFPGDYRLPRSGVVEQPEKVAVAPV